MNTGNFDIDERTKQEITNEKRQDDLLEKYYKYGYLVIKTFDNGYKYYYGRHNNFTANTDTFEWNGMKVFLNRARAEKIAKKYGGEVVKFNEHFTEVKN